MRRAKRTVEEKAEQVGRAERLTARQRNDCEEALTVLGAAKVLALNQALQPFSQAFSRLKNVDLEVNVGEHGAPPVDEVRLREVGRLTASALDVLGGVGASAAAAAIASGSTSYAVGALATAGTGTAISSLGGAAASNAALAWLGGGTLAAGGGGMAAGAMIASGVAAAPALAVGGVLLLAKGKESLGKAERFSADAGAALASHRQSQVVLSAVTKEAQRTAALLEQLTPSLAREAGWLDAVTSSTPDWSALDKDTRERIRSVAAVALVLSDLVHTPVLDENGELTRAIADACARAGSIVHGNAS